MERREAFDSINRNTKNMFNHIRSKLTRNNVVAPEILVSHVWMQDDEPNGVEIIELNSSTESESPEEHPVAYSQAWNYVDNSRLFQVHDNYYEINKIARDRHRSSNTEKDFSVKFGNFYYDDDNEGRNEDYEEGITDFCEVPLNHQMNCFTIINNHILNSDSTTSSDQEYATLGIVDPQNFNSNYWDHVYKEDKAKFEATTEQNRTIWIYSFNNKHLLSENDFNIQSQDAISSLSSSSTSDEGKKKDQSVSRLGSPIPPAYIPRLDLSLGQTLSTVTEISELKQSGDSDEPLKQPKSKNNWFTNRIKERNKESFTSTDAPSSKNNVIQWMALSPRERRRRFKITEVTSNTEKKEPETLIYMEGNTEINATDMETPTKITSSKVQVNVDVHAIDEEIISVPDDSKSNSVDDNDYTSNEHTATESNDATYVVPIGVTNDDKEIDTRLKIKKSNVPLIRFNSTIDKNSMTSPIQQLDSQNWILEEKNDKETANVEYEINSNKNKQETPTEEITNEEVVSRRLFAQNMKLLGNSDWHNYLPITGSPPSLEFSVSYSSIGRKSLLRRMAGCFNKCCR